MDIKVYDWQGAERDMAYLRDKYGPFIIQPAASGTGFVFRISALREKLSGPASLIVAVKDEQGRSLEAIPVAWYWPDAPQDGNAGPQGGVPPEMRPGRCVQGQTNANGDVGFGMGPGAYYWPSQGQIGPHASWVYGADTRSDLILGLGMVAATTHDHFDVEFVRLDDGSGPVEPPDGPECPTDEILAELDRIEESVRAIRALLKG